MAPSLSVSRGWIDRHLPIYTYTRPVVNFKKSLVLPFFSENVMIQKEGYVLFAEQINNPITIQKILAPNQECCFNVKSKTGMPLHVTLKLFILSNREMYGTNIVWHQWFVMYTQCALHIFINFHVLYFILLSVGMDSTICYLCISLLISMHENIRHPLIWQINETTEKIKV